MQRSVSSVAQLCPALRPHGLQHTRPPCPSPTPGVYSNSCLSSWWCHPTISSSVVPFSSHLQSFPASGSFLVSQLFTSDGQSIGVFSFSISHSNEYSRLISALYLSELTWNSLWTVTVVKNWPAMQETWVWSLGRKDPLEKEMANHSSILAWEALRTEEPGGLQSMGRKVLDMTWRLSMHPVLKIR